MIHLRQVLRLLNELAGIQGGGQGGEGGGTFGVSRSFSLDRPEEDSIRFRGSFFVGIYRRG